MKRCRSIFLILLLAVASCNGQSSCFTKGYIIDSINKEPLADVEVFFLNSSEKRFSDNNGCFQIPADDTICNIEIKSISCNPKKISFLCSADSIYKFCVTRKSYELSPVEITTNKPIDIIADIKYQVTDYEFIGDFIVLLAYENQSIFLPKLLLVNQEGDTLNAVNVCKPVCLARDYDGKVYFISKTTSYEILVSNNELKLTEPQNKEDFENINKTIVGHCKDNYYLKQYLYNDQILNYYNYDEVNDKLYCFRTITDDENIQRNRRGAYFDGSEADLRFQQLIMNKPVYAPLVTLNDTIMVFNFLQSKIEKYSMSSDTIQEIPITFHDDNGFLKKVCIDNIRSKVYYLFYRNGISQLKEISTSNGKIIGTIDIPDFVFVEKIKVYDGNLYFLYKTKDWLEYKKLYKMKI